MATVHVRAGSIEKVKEGDRPAGEVAGIEFVRMRDGAAVFRVGSGVWRFTSAVGGE
jgi:hypothetical protein